MKAPSETAKWPKYISAEELAEYLDLGEREEEITKRRAQIRRKGINGYKKAQKAKEK